MPGEYYLEFNLRVLPRRGDDYIVPGRMWGARNENGPISRVVLTPANPGTERRLLVQSGRNCRLWSWSGSEPDKVEALGDDALFTPLATTNLTPFDLQMPFIYWDDFVYEGVVPMRGRPADAFLFYPPADIAARRPELTGVRVYLDSQYGALVQAEEIGDQGEPLKAISVVELRKVKDQWIVKTIDLRDERTRDKTRFSVTGAALELDLAGSVFEADGLRDRVAPPAGVVDTGS